MMANDEHSCIPKHAPQQKATMQWKNNRSPIPVHDHCISSCIVRKCSYGTTLSEKPSPPSITTIPPLLEKTTVSRVQLLPRDGKGIRDGITRPQVSPPEARHSLRAKKCRRACAAADGRRDDVAVDAAEKDLGIWDAGEAGLLVLKCCIDGNWIDGN